MMRAATPPPTTASHGSARTHKPQRARPQPDTLVLSGGGIKGLAMLGALDRLRTEGMLTKVRTVVGTSAGALVGALVATRRDFRDALGVICSHGYSPDFDFARLACKFGLDSGKSIESLFGALLAGLPEGLTFGDVKRTYGVSLVVCVTNVSKRRAEYLGPDTHADMPVALAIRMTCSVPLYFSAVRHEGSWYVDGSIVDNFPCDWAACHGGGSCVLGLCASSVPASIGSFESFVGAVVESAASSQHCADVDVLNLELPNTTSLHFGAPGRELTRLFFQGSEQADAFIKKRV
jgi:predicted acylesterase/phospholipase RssA